MRRNGERLARFSLTALSPARSKRRGEALLLEPPLEIHTCDVRQFTCTEYTSSSKFWSLVRPRLIRLFTVPIGSPVISAISS